MSKQPSQSDRPDDSTNAALIEAARREIEALAGPPRSGAVPIVPPASFKDYSLLQELHRGGQGVVYHAIEKATQREVAIKLLKHGPLASSADRARFEREVEILTRLNHPHIVTIRGSGVVAGCQYFVTDYVPGQPLDAFADDERPVDELLRVFAKVCEAVSAAQLHGVIHRDLKPSNIRIDPKGEPHVLDFGLAKVASSDAEATSMTATGQFMGSLPWASPEQAAGLPSKIDVRTDVYSLGVILYQMLTDRFPYEVVGNMREVLERIMKADPARPSSTRRRISDEVETIVLRCLAKQPARRYQSAADLARDVRHYLAAESIEATRDSFIYQLWKQLQRRRVPVAVAAAFVIVVAAGVVTSLTFRRQVVEERDRTKRAVNGSVGRARVPPGAAQIGSPSDARPKRHLNSRSTPPVFDLDWSELDVQLAARGLGHLFFEGGLTMRRISLYILTGCVTLGLSASTSYAQTTWIVCCNGTGDFLTIQEGIDAASNGDLVLVRNGTYDGLNNRDMDFGSRLITVRAEDDDQNCIIDCEGSAMEPHRAFWFHNGENRSAVVEGFTIQNGYIVGNGGAILCEQASSPTISNCRFSDNAVQASDTAWAGMGGAIHCASGGGPMIESCRFIGNSAIGSTVTTYTGFGGAFGGYGAGSVVISDCTFRNNTAIANTGNSGAGGAIAFMDSPVTGDLTIENCMFVGNETSRPGSDPAGGGGAIWTRYCLSTAIECTFIKNLGEKGGGAVWIGEDGDAHVTHCTFAANQAPPLGTWDGGAADAYQCQSVWDNCIFVGNTAAQDAGALWTGAGGADMASCTIAHNRAGSRGGGVFTRSYGMPTETNITNSVVWGNWPDQIYDLTYEFTTATYSDVQDGTGEAWFGTGCIDAYPQFVGGPSGTWTAHGDPNALTGETTFYDSLATWDPNELAGMFLRPNTDLDPNLPHGHLQSLIVSNTATEVTVWGDLAWLGTAGASYRINDYHLLSGSPCIDTGDPAVLPPGGTDLDGRIRVWDGDDDGVWRIDMGCYEFGSRCLGNLEGDDEIGLADLAQLLSHYGMTSGAEYEDGDLDFDGDVDLGDLAALLGVYGTVCE